MSYGADEFAVLDDGGAGHALDDAAGGFQEPGVGNFNEHIAAAPAVFGINFQNVLDFSIIVCYNDFNRNTVR